MNQKLTSQQIAEVCDELVAAHGRAASNSMVKRALLAKYGSPNGGERVAGPLRASKLKRGFAALPPASDIFENVTRITESGCWIWERAVSREGYGKVGQLFAHRLAWESKNGPIPPGMYICHRCDVRACINPAHLFLGTPSENMQDCSRKGRLNDKSRLNLRPRGRGPAFPATEAVTITVI